MSKKTTLRTTTTPRTAVSRAAAIPAAISDYMAEIGAKGGRARGPKKKRDASHYKKMVDARRKNKSKKALKDD